jgi:catechol 2,3-dioxygenase-like lactoylglutathione lyase family enzyme
LYSIGHEEIERDGNGERDMPTIVHFQIPSNDTERSKKFFNDLFGWKFDKFPSPPGSDAMPEGMEYWWRYDEKTIATTAGNYKLF